MVIRQFLILVFLSLLSFSVFAKVSANVDRAIIEEGESFILTIKSDGDSPELEILEQFFDVLGTSQSSKISFTNGKVNSEKEWIVTLSPKNIGISVIPAVTVGDETTPPISIQVVKPKAVNAAQGADIFLEVSLDTNSVYVQAEVIYIARLYRAVEIREGSLTEPEINTAIIERMGEDVTFQATRNQRRYQVTERRFAVFPQQSGSLVIPPTVFDGQVVSNRSTNRSTDPFDRFFQSQQRLRRVQVKSDALVLGVMPQPASFNGDIWLPAKRLVLTESWSVDPPAFKVGEPITRTVTIQVIGQTGAQLPEFEIHPTDGIKQYVDQPSVETGLSEGSLVGVREEKFAVIPRKSGTLVLPEIRLFWWDTEMDKEQMATIPPRVIEVAPAEISDQLSQVETSVPEEKEPVVETPSKGPVDLAFVAKFGYWPWLALALGSGWLLTIFAWVYRAKKKRSSAKSGQTSSTSDEISLNEAKKQLKSACALNDPNQAKVALIAWVNSAWPENKTHSVLVVGERLHDSTVKQAVAELDEILYFRAGENWDGEKFWTDVGPRLKKPRHTERDKLKSLPSLYPK